MPFAIALLCHPAGACGFLVLAAASLVYGLYARRFLPLFTGSAAATLTTLAFLHVPPNGLGLALLAVGIALLNAEFLVSTAGTAGALGFVATTAGFWLLLAPPTAAVALQSGARTALAFTGATVVLLAIVRGLRHATVRPGAAPGASGRAPPTST